MDMRARGTEDKRGSEPWDLLQHVMLENVDLFTTSALETRRAAHGAQPSELTPRARPRLPTASGAFVIGGRPATSPPPSPLPKAPAGP